MFCCYPLWLLAQFSLMLTHLFGMEDVKLDQAVAALKHSSSGCKITWKCS